MKRAYLISILFVLFCGSNIVFGQSAIPAKFKKATSVDSGFFNIYKLKSNIYFEIPVDLMGRDMLLASRISQLSDTKNRSKLVAGQMLRNPLMVRFSFDDKLVYLHKPNPDRLIDKADPLYGSFKKNNLIPVITTFKIEGRTSKSVFIDVTKFFMGDLPCVSPVGGKAKPGKLDSKLTKILSADAFEGNIEIRTKNFYTGERRPFITIMQKSLVLLSKEPMKPRIFDNRMNYFSQDKEVYSSKQQEVQKLAYVHRFDIQPKKSDIDKYKRGELVEPEKSIVFYVDTTLPYKWREAVKRGIEYWNIAFEKIGFKNTVIAKDYPKDPGFNADDIRYNCFKYIATDMANATGPHWVDPRTGEIIQSDVLWFDNVRKLLHKWRFMQTAAVDPKARKKVLDDETMCEMISYSAAHEVGHCLGMVHNMRASYAYPTDSLRSATFTQKYGTTPSIMDYARFNYIAQPGDKGLRLLPPHLGLYDIFSIKLAYKPVLDAKDEFEDNKVVKEWISEKETEPLYIFNKQSGMGIATDPSRQSVSLGNDIVKASAYGINNLKYILANLKKWMHSKGESYDYIREMYGNIFKENFRYLTHTVGLIGGVYEYNSVDTDKVPLVVPVKKEKALEAIDLIFAELATQADWLNNDYIISFAGDKGDELSKQQRQLLKGMLGTGIFKRMYQYGNDESVLAINEYLRYLTEKLFGNNQDEYMHALQLNYISALKKFAMQEYKDSEEKYILKLRLTAAAELVYIKKKAVKKIKDKGYKEYLLKELTKQ